MDFSGNVLHSYRYNAFGVELNPNPSNTNRFRFNGEYHDLHRGGEIYLRARIYNPRTRRFLTEDPHWTIHTGNIIFGDSPTMRNDRYMPSVHAILQSGNLYMFTLHNPVRWVDPSGLYIKCPIKLWEMVKSGYKYGEKAVKWFIDENIRAARWIGNQGQRGWEIVSGWFSRGGSDVQLVHDMLTRIEPNRIHHIMQLKHRWDLVRADTWIAVSDIINKALQHGTSIPNSVGNVIYTYVINGHKVEVTIRLVDGTMRIVDAWVRTR